MRKFTNEPEDGTIWSHKLVTPLLLPLSLLWDIFFYWKTQLNLLTGRGRESHATGVARVQEQVRHWRKTGDGRKMCTARPKWMSITQQPQTYKDKMYRVKIDLANILEVDTGNRTVKVEPSVTIGMLNRVLVSKGFTLPVVPELDELTIGGLVMGGGIESTSHKHGLLHHTCVEYELVMADASVVIANKDTNKDLFYALPFTYGTLGFLTAVTINIVPYKPYIRLRYQPATSLEEATEIFTNATTRDTDNDSVEGIMFGENEAVVMSGVFVEEREVDQALVNNIGRWYKPWFFRHVMTALDTGPRTEYIPTLHFHQRHNKPCFWLSEAWFPLGTTAIFRFLFGWLLPLNAQFLKLIRTSLLPEVENDRFILQDFMIPLSHLKKCLRFLWSEVGVNPLWLVPARLNVHKEHGLQPRCDEIYIDVGVYGFCYKKDYNRNDVLRQCEKFTIDHLGYQALYAETLMTRDEMEVMFGEGFALYKKLREELPLCKEGFPELYEKVSKKAREDKKHQD